LERPKGETGMKIKVTEYVHGSSEEFADWEVDLHEKGSYDMYGDAGNKLHFRLSEIAITMEIDLETGEYEITEVDGRTLLPKESISA
jgi:hypothetical protein